ncbi:MAG: GAF domain-containing sensor histidine kinase [Actinomycetota bacterium]|nr:GAF domain-containing sensor histidine kinase [Actinomycetota bacterium]
MPHRSIRDPDRLHALLDAVLVVGSGLDLEGVLRRIVATACDLTDARYGALGVLDESGTTLERFVHVGIDDESVARIGRPPEGAGLLGRLVVDPKPLRLTDSSAHQDSVGFPPGHPRMQSFLGVPLVVRGGEACGNLYLTEKLDGKPFTDIDEALVQTLASAASIAVEKARLHARVRELTLAADRERIARDLHDTVIQRLFGVGLLLQGVLPMTEVTEVRDRISEAVADIDDAIRQIRTTIFALATPAASATGLRARILEVCAQASRSLGFDPDVRFAGPVDRLVSSEVGSELLATLREALANVVHHARATEVHVTVSVGVEVHLEVHDNGIGPQSEHPHSAGGRGLPNMAQRAQALRGSFTLAAHPHGGTVLSWRVPLASPAEITS